MRSNTNTKPEPEVIRIDAILPPLNTDTQAAYLERLSTWCYARAKEMMDASLCNSFAAASNPGHPGNREIIQTSLMQMGAGQMFHQMGNVLGCAAKSHRAAMALVRQMQTPALNRPTHMMFG